MKVFLILQIIFAAVCFQLTSFGYPETPTVKWKGMNDENDLVFFYKEGVTYEQKEAFQNNVLYKSRADGRGKDHPDGVIDLMLGHIKGNHDGGIINFSETATNEQREKLKQSIQESPVVYKVYENVVPNEIKDL